MITTIPTYTAQDNGFDIVDEQSYSISENGTGGSTSSFYIVGYDLTTFINGWPVNILIEGTTYNNGAYSVNNISYANNKSLFIINPPYPEHKFISSGTMRLCPIWKDENGNFYNFETQKSARFNADGHNIMCKQISINNIDRGIGADSGDVRIRTTILADDSGGGYFYFTAPQYNHGYFIIEPNSGIDCSGPGITFDFLENFGLCTLYDADITVFKSAGGNSVVITGNSKFKTFCSSGFTSTFDLQAERVLVYGTSLLQSDHSPTGDTWSIGTMMVETGGTATHLHPHPYVFTTKTVIDSEGEDYDITHQICDNVFAFTDAIVDWAATYISLPYKNKETILGYGPYDFSYVTIDDIFYSSLGKYPFRQPSSWPDILNEGFSLGPYPISGSGIAASQVLPRGSKEEDFPTIQAHTINSNETLTVSVTYNDAWQLTEFSNSSLYQHKLFIDGPIKQWLNISHIINNSTTNSTVYYYGMLPKKTGTYTIKLLANTVFNEELNAVQETKSGPSIPFMVSETPKPKFVVMFWVPDQIYSASPITIGTFNVQYNDVIYCIEDGVKTIAHWKKYNKAYIPAVTMCQLKNTKYVL